jgi:hypothetical protein
MAKQRNNMVMRSTRGMVGGQIVFKRRAGKGYVSAPPEVNENRKPTENQEAAQSKFRRSTQYSALAMKSPELKKAYQKAALRGQSPQNVAFQDAYFAPVILGLLTQGYTGAVGNIIIVHAHDNFKVNSVKVSIYNADDELIEEGAASANEDGLSWTYITTQVNANLPGTKIKASAFDIPENEGSLEVTL